MAKRSRRNGEKTHASHPGSKRRRVKERYMRKNGGKGCHMGGRARGAVAGTPVPYSTGSVHNHI